MNNTPPIPFGYKLVQGSAQKGDGVWNGERFAKARKQWPSTEPAIIIRRCEVRQPELVREVEVMELD